MGCKVIKKCPWLHRGPPGPPARRPPSENPKNDSRTIFLVFYLFDVHQITRIAGMTDDSDRNLTRFGRASPLNVSMGIAADLGVALVVAMPSSSKATDQQVESTGHVTILSGSLD